MAKDHDTPDFLLVTYNFIPLQLPTAYVNQIIMSVKVANGC